MSVFETNKRNEESFLATLTTLLDAGPEKHSLLQRKRRRLEDIVCDLCDDADVASGKMQASQPVRPWVYDDFLVRLRSFKASLWFAMPLEISPLECARHGWTNSAPSTLKCLSCSVEIKHSDDVSPMDFRSRLSTAHEGYCGWNDNPSSESFCYFQLDAASILYSKFNINAETFTKLLFSQDSATADAVRSLLQHRIDVTAMRNSIERTVDHGRHSIQQLVLSLLDRSENIILGAQAILDALVKKRGVTFPIELSADRSAVSVASPIEAENSGDIAKNAAEIVRGIFILSIFGWSMQLATDENNAGGAELFCGTCGRSITLSSLGDVTLFNGINQHRFFCPWVARSQHQLCGWEVYAACTLGAEGMSFAVPAETAGAAAPIADTTSKNSTADRAQLNRRQPVDMFNKIQSVISMLSGSPYNSASSGKS